MSMLTIAAGELRENLVLGIGHEYQEAEVYGILADSSADDRASVTVKKDGAIRNFTLGGEDLLESSSLVLEQGATGVSITVDDCGEFVMRNGSVCDGVLLVNGGQMTVEGALTQTSGIALEWGKLTLRQSANITGVDVRGEKGELDVTAGTSVSYSTISAGTIKVTNGTLSEVIVTGGEVCLEGTTGDTLLRNAVILGGTVSDGHKVAKNNKARIEDITVGKNATITLLHNVTLAGTISLAGNLTLQNKTTGDDAVLAFDMQNRTNSNEALLHGYSYMKGTFTFLLSLDWNQARRNLFLADGIDEEEGEESTAKATLSIGGNNYNLNERQRLEVGFLSLSMNRTSAGELFLSVGNADFCEKKQSLTWESETVGGIVEFASDKDFEDAIQVSVENNGVDLLADAPDRNWWRVVDGEGTVIKAAESINGSSFVGIARCFAGDCDGVADLFFAKTDLEWKRNYSAHHVGNGDWTGTGESVDLQGKKQYIDIFLGGGDASALYLSDEDDALFVDDIFSHSYQQKGKEGTRLSNLTEICAGAGDDVVDLTSRDFAFGGDTVTIRGGEGNDVLWGGSLHNILYGDEGNDRLVGGGSSDILWGGAGNDSMHGGGGDDCFCFGLNWGQDTIEQVDGGSVTLCFYEGIKATDLTVTASSVTMGKNTIAVKTAGVQFWFEG